MARHHIIPTHEGGTDHPWNLIDIPDHVHHDIHFARWVEGGDYRDYIGSVIALNATHNGKKGGWHSRKDSPAAHAKGVQTKHEKGIYKLARRKAALKMDQPKASKLGWDRMSKEARVAREAKRLATWFRNKQNKDIL